MVFNKKLRYICSVYSRYPIKKQASEKKGKKALKTQVCFDLLKGFIFHPETTLLDHSTPAERDPLK